MEKQAELPIEDQDSMSIDPEWLKLILKAKRNGLTINEIREFFQQTGTSNN